MSYSDNGNSVPMCVCVCVGVCVCVCVGGWVNIVFYMPLILGRFS